jgi:hypothetical protein
MRHLQSINNMLRTLGISALFVFPALSASASQPYVEFSGISGNAGTISLSRVPIVLSNGQVIYKDVILLLQANASGVLSSSISQLNSPIFPAQPLQSGIYVDVSSTNYGFEMTGPGQLPNGVGKWIIRPVTGLAGNDCGIPATIYTGPLNASPLAARLSAAKITSTEYSYGVLDSNTGACDGQYWGANYLIGVSQVGNQVEFALFTYNGGDHNIAGARVNYILSKKL